MIRRLLLPALLLLSACDPPLGEVREKNKALVETTRKRFEAISRLVGAPKHVPDAECKPAQPLHPAFDEKHDAEVISYDRLAEAGADHDSYAKWSEVPIYGDSALHEVLQDSHPTMAKYRAPDMKVSKSWLARYGMAANVKHLVVVRTRTMDREAGTATLDAYLVEYSDAPKVICTLTEELSVGANLGTTGYQVVERNTKTGAEKVVRTDSHDNFENAMYSARSQLEKKMKAAWGIGIDEKQKR